MIRQLVNGMAGRFGYEIRKRRPELDAMQMIAGQISSLPNPVLFDVGAHHGETAETFARMFPAAEVWSFEPFPDSFKQLQAGSGRYPRARLFNLGFSDQSGPLDFHINVGSPTNSLLPVDPRAVATWRNEGLRSSRRVTCNFVTIDEWVAEHRVGRIDLLKLDVQGAEHRVLAGARNALSAGVVERVYMEVIVGPTYQDQRGVGEYMGFLEGFDFRLFGIYNAAYGRHGNVIQFDALFVRAQSLN